MDTNLATPTPVPARRRLAALALAAVLAVGGVACGSDDDDGATDAPDTTETTAATGDAPVGDPASSSDEPSGDADLLAFCEAHEAVEAAFMEGDESAIGAAVEAFTAAAPDEFRDAVDTAIGLALDGQEGSPEFVAAYGELLDAMQEPCDRNLVAVSATDYAYDDVPEAWEAGPTVVKLRNDGTEFHHMVVYRVADGVTDSVEDLLPRSHEEGGPMTGVGAVDAMPGETGSSFLGLEPGRHIAMCLVPTGTTPENLDAIQAGEAGGPPHFEHGMYFEFTVA